MLIGNAGIVMQLDDTLHFLSLPPQGASIVIDGWAELESDDQVMDRFSLEAGSVRQALVTTDLGGAQRLTASGVAELPGGGQLRRSVAVDAYPQ